MAKLLTVLQAAGVVGLHPETLRAWCREGRVPHQRIGQAYVFDERELKRFKREREAAKKQKKLAL